MTKRHKPVLVFVNPAGGAGKAYRLVMEHAVGVWSEAEFQYHIVITGWSTSLAMQANAIRFSRVCGSRARLCANDSTSRMEWHRLGFGRWTDLRGKVSPVAFETNGSCFTKVINGLMGRSDWQDALQLPIGHVPCGSGNAFITNIVRYSK